MENQKEIRTYFLVYLALLGFLGLTVGVTLLKLPAALSTGLSLSIAFAKAALVLIFFMGLREVSSKIRFFAFATLLWTLILISLISLDYATRDLNGVLGK